MSSRFRSSAHTSTQRTTSPFRARFLALGFYTALCSVVSIPVLNTAACAASTVQQPVHATLPNGLRVVIVPDALAPVVTTELNYLTGSAEAPKGFPGTAHALEHMMFRGSDGLDKDQLSTIGARLGGSYNADTTEDVTQYFYTAPAEDLPILLKIEALRMNGLTLSQADWEKERGAISQEVSRDLSSPSYRYISQLQGILFKNTPYEFDALGSRPSFDKTDAALLKKFYKTWYAPNNAILVITGDVDPEKTLQQIRDIFGPIPSRKLPEPAIVKPGPVPAKTLNIPTNYPVSFATIAFPMPGMTSKAFATADILSDVLGSQRGALYQLVPAGKALFAGFEFAPKKQAGFGIAIAAFPKGGNAKESLDNIQNILAEIKNKGVPADLVEAAKRRSISELGFSANSISGLASVWSTALAFQNLTSPDEMIAAYQSVTPEDVNHLAAHILDPAHAVTAILTPEESGKPVAGAGFGGAESFGGAPEKPVTLPEWAEAALSTPTLPPAAPAPSVFKLDNGLSLIVRPAHVSHTIQLSGMIQTEPALQEPAGQEGVSGIVDELFSYGTSTHDRLAFRKALDDIPAWESAGSGFSLRASTENFPAAMTLLAENELHPAFPEQAFTIVRQQNAQAQAGVLKSPAYLFERAITTAVNPPNDPTLRQTTPSTIMSITLNDVRDYYKKTFRPDMTTIVITGDITPQQALDITRREFGTWKASGPKPDINLPKRPDNKATNAHVPDSSSVQDTVVLAESIGNMDASNPERYFLQLGDEVLGDGFSSRLYRDLRVKNGYVYTVSSGLSFSRTRAGYSISFGADPDKVGAAARLALKNLEDMQSQFVTDSELNIAKSSILRSLPLQQASLDSIASHYLGLMSLGLPLNQSDIAAKIYYDATAENIRDAWKKYLRPADFATVIKGPAVK